MKHKLLKILPLVALFTFSITSYAKTVIAIDAGHGGKDPGAMGKTLGIKEKDVTLSIAKELKSLLDADPNFRAVMTRSGDYFIQLPNRTEIARKNKANYLVSIHADSSPSSENLRGSSVWVLSNRRANDELGKWLEDHEKQSELLGGAGSVLAQANERYLSQTVLDLQFSHSQRSGYELGKTILSKMSNVTKLAKSAPQHASLSVLRSPDIPSILVETGFLSNATEEKQLSSLAYRRQIARAIYNGLVEYQRKYYKVSPKAIHAEKNESKKERKESKSETKETKKVEQSQAKPNNKAEAKKTADKTSNETTKGNTKTKEKTSSKESKKEVDINAKFHIVQQDETLYSIARMYKTTPEKLSQLNDIKQNKIVVGKKLKLR
ncbi:N-acetylmuramoyl-L-alanine amidase [Ursidibacter maritimus]|uniref:N-acetylmuramoyl-L-alanine amidase n=1 Tax=Ursidibacter maritimus TaxID=1331689 RepID=A0A949WNE2_9PAST|nr:N-acetylmuramoyl-L-alanine amidase [Ursidibacter maritimus]KAE9541972.1 N-acetylmuramoyl-L-alanine amidase [Ursidibacter maritimus]MBV6523227.1 N-acetylmuramoyl-L-alanine amidase [Ursidibacter maritimus]MBV6525683.1 N-acetylmuramoyl-L-alanine amidase [Ursidibacter maritimus]MBV6527421.1 N-acetylmuramoyl-L-alanine amidase [Ursidibacter maritimus]MBV6529446.1 N-acetylmuramoyl-L-alanine amidase [Ursidibacter maritimus]